MGRKALLVLVAVLIWLLVVESGVALARSHDPSSMQWQTKADANAKDKTERKRCGR
jgi:hypothetical protein